MKISDWLKKLIPHVIIIVIFVAVVIAYFSPVLKGKMLAQHDTIMAKGAAEEIKEYKDSTGKQALWTNSLFGGMPAYLINMDYPNSWTTKLGRIFTNLLPAPANYVFLLLACCYIFLIVAGLNYWLSFIGAIAFAFSSYNFISLDAGHISKIVALAYCPPIVAGVMLTFRGRYLAGGAMTALFLALQLYGNHVQITYYLFLALAIYGAIELYFAIKGNRLKNFSIAVVTLVIAVAISCGSHASRLWTTYEYSTQTIRGKSELTSNKQSTGGLDRDYAFSWSLGKMETFTFLIPDFYGGSSSGSLTDKSETYKILVQNNVPRESAKEFISHLPLYWGPQPNTSGPVYIGAIICFLFVLAIFVVKDRIKWWIVSVVVLFTFLAWGRFFSVFNDLFFDYFPMYNKFRAVTIILALVEIFMTFLAVWGLKEIVLGKMDKVEIKKYIKYSFFIIGGILLFFAVLAPAVMDFQQETSSEEPSSDASFLSQLKQMTQSEEFGNKIFNAVVEDRASMLRSDAFRGLLFVILAAGLLWAFVSDKLKEKFLYVGLALLILIDLWSVDKRYLNTTDFVSKKEFQNEFAETPADTEILRDKSLDYRVLNTTVSPFNDATTSYHHKSIGGYHAAKMRRYQELIENHLSSQLTKPVLDMLNTKYIISQDKQTGAVFAQPNPDALGNVWFVNNYKIVDNADQEIAALKDFKPKETAVIDKRFKDRIDHLSIKPDSSASIKLMEYKPDELTYQSKASSDQLAVFSEIYYNDKLGWEAFVDGKPVSHFRADYVLRAMVVPAGEHQIEFKFHPKSFYTGENIALISSVLLFLACFAAIYFEVKRLKIEVK